VITVDRRRMVSLLLSTYEAAIHRNTELNQTQETLSSLNEHLEDLVEQRTAALAAEIAERQRALEQLRLTTRELQSSETRQRTIIEADANGLVVLNREGVIRFLNPAAQVLLGRPSEQLLGEPFGFPVTTGAIKELDMLVPGPRTEMQGLGPRTEMQGLCPTERGLYHELRWH
jgi:PAS domain-containing protein